MKENIAFSILNFPIPLHTRHMAIRLLTQDEDLQRYTTWLQGHSEKTLWQSLEWKAYQEALGREIRIYVGEDDGKITASAQVVIDRTTFGWTTWDVPRGPMFTDVNAAIELLDFLVQEAKKYKCLQVTFSSLQPRTHPAFRISNRHEQPEATRIIDLTQSDEKILEQMKQKGRYNIKVAEKNGVTVEKSEDVVSFHELLQSTSERDAFGVHGLNHYEQFMKALPGSFLLLAYAFEHKKKPIAGLMGVIWGSTGIYYYGASSYESRSLMAPYALQWAAMQYCKIAGCTQYDLLGVAPPDAADDHAWQGISAFKEKFGGELITYPREQIAILKPFAANVLKLKRKLLG